MVLEGDPDGRVSDNKLLEVVKLCLNGQVLPNGDIVDREGKRLGVTVLNSGSLKKFYQPRKVIKAKRKRKNSWDFSDDD